MQDFSARKIRNLFNSASKDPLKLSRSKIDLFSECPRCFYLDRKLGINRPQGPAFTLNLAVDYLLKKEFDIHRKQKTSHPLMDTYGIDARPFDHPEMSKWRENFTGVQYLHKQTNFLVTGAVDDVWINKEGELIVVDYKATSKAEKIESLDDSRWNNQYKRQMEIYQWLFRQNGFKTSDTGYFVYVNGKKDRESFDGRLEFDVTVIPYKGSGAWIEKILKEIKSCLLLQNCPKASENCEYCKYIESAKEIAGKPKKAIEIASKEGLQDTIFGN